MLIYMKLISKAILETINLIFIFIFILFFIFLFLFLFIIQDIMVKELKEVEPEFGYLVELCLQVRKFICN